MVDFVASKTGQYTIAVQKYRADEYSKSLGIAWVKDATYLPDVKVNWGGWQSTIYVRNDGATQTTPTIIFYDTAGTSYGPFNPSAPINPNGVWTFPLTSGQFNGSAIVSGSEDLSVMVKNVHPSAPYSSGAYNGVAADKTGSTFYAPLLAHQTTTASGEGNSRLNIQNVSAVASTVTIRFYNSSGSLSYTRQVTLNPNAADSYGLDNLPAQWFGSATISAGGGAKLAVIADVTMGNDILLSHNAFSSESVGAEWVVPQFASRLNNMSGAPLSTPLVVQNLSGGTLSAGAIQLNCVADPGSVPPAAISTANGTAVPNRAAYFGFNPVVDTTTFPTGWNGSCRITTTGNVVVLAQMRFVGSANAAAYEAIRTNGTSHTVIFPVVQKRLGDGSATSAIIQNLSSTSIANVILNYYGSPGCNASNYGPLSFSIPAKGSLNRNHRLSGSGLATEETSLPNGWCGSLVVTSSNQPIDGFIQLTNINNPAGDTFMAHNAFAR